MNGCPRGLRGCGFTLTIEPGERACEPISKEWLLIEWPEG